MSTYNRKFRPFHLRWWAAEAGEAHTQLEQVNMNDASMQVVKVLESAADVSDTAGATAAEKAAKAELHKQLAKMLGLAPDDPLIKAEVVRLGDKITVPAGMPLTEAIKQLKKQLEYESQAIEVSKVIRCSYWDGCHAMFLAMSEIYGWVNQLPEMGWFGPQPPKTSYIQTGIHSTVSVPTGTFTVPNIQGVLSTGWEALDGRIVFKIYGNILRKDESKFQRIALLTESLVRSKSIYRGKAFRLEMTDAQGNNIPVPVPKFLDVTKYSSADLVLPKHIFAQVAANIFTPIVDRVRAERMGIPIKRGHLLSGPYGTGKTLTAYVAARLAEDNGMTFIYCSKSQDLADVLRFAEMYQPAVVFCEDVDRVTNGERTLSMDEILNIIDGVESKGLEIMTVVTTNKLEQINEAMLRPGRVLDSLIQYTAPDAEAAMRLIKKHGGALIAVNEDLTEVGKACEGMIPAVIESVVMQAKLFALWHDETGREDLQLTAEALLDSATMKRAQLEAIKRDPTPSKADVFYNAFSGMVEGAKIAGVTRLVDRVLNTTVGSMPPLIEAAVDKAFERNR